LLANVLELAKVLDFRLGPLPLVDFPGHPELLINWLAGTPNADKHLIMRNFVFGCNGANLCCVGDP
jgi:hypothetical protein